MKRIFAFIICLIGVILPWRLRIIFAELLGWILQAIYFIFYSILKCIITNLKEKGRSE